MLSEFNTKALSGPKPGYPAPGGTKTARNASEFFDALKNRDEETAKALLDAGLDPNTQHPDSKIPALSYALWVGSPVAETLIAAGANPNHVDASGRTPLHWAARNGSTNSIRLAIAHQDNINATDPSGYTPLHLAAGHGNTKSACLLIHHGAKTGITDNEGLTAADVAVAEGQRRTAEKMRETICLIHARKAARTLMARRKKA